MSRSTSAPSTAARGTDLPKNPACSGLKGALPLSDMHASGKKLVDKILDVELLGQRLCTLDLLETGKIPFLCTFQLKEMSNFSLTFTKTELLLNSFINNLRWKRKEG